MHKEFVKIDSQAGTPTQPLSLLFKVQGLVAADVYGGTFCLVGLSLA